MTRVAQALAQSRPARSGRDTQARWLNAAARILHGREASSRRWINDDVQTRVLICERVDATARVPIGWPTPMRRLGTLLAVAMLVSPAAVAAATHSPRHIARSLSLASGSLSRTRSTTEDFWS